MTLEMEEADMTISPMISVELPESVWNGLKLVLGRVGDGAHLPPIGVELAEKLYDLFPGHDSRKERRELDARCGELVARLSDYSRPNNKAQRFIE